MEQMMQDVADGDVTVKAVLSKDDAREFLSDFSELEVSKSTEVTTNKKGSEVEITLKTNDDTGFLLKACFRNGLLQHWGWSKKFKIEN